MDMADIEGFDSLDVSHRLDGWQKRFLYLVDEELAKPFRWVNANCVDLMAASILACYGPDHPALHDIPEFTSAAQAIEELAMRGGLEVILDGYFVSVPKAHAFQADIALLKNVESGEEAGAVILDGMVVGKHPPAKDGEAPKRAFRLPIEAAYKVYRV